MQTLNTPIILRYYRLWGKCQLINKLKPYDKANKRAAARGGAAAPCSFMPAAALVCLVALLVALLLSRA